MEGEVVPSIAREGNRKVGLYEIPERSLNESLNATIARIHATVDFPLQPFVLASRHGLYSRPPRPPVPLDRPFATLFHFEAPCSAFNAGLSAKTTARAVLRRCDAAI